MPKGRVLRSRNMSSRGTGCRSEATKPGGTNLRRGRGVPERHREPTILKEGPMYNALRADALRSRGFVMAKKKAGKKKAVKAIEKAVKKAVRRGVTKVSVEHAVDRAIEKGVQKKKVAAKKAKADESKADS